MYLEMDNHESNMFRTYEQDSVTFHEVNLYNVDNTTIILSPPPPHPNIFF